ncbi:alpha/beta fold hydrolase [Flammeovirga sp. SJP92]|uniref:alpha/beta fold hydrolase n=1 Tax=Flammeovirga sp. SJP92 TaxID=1775430 RepID=UPI0007889144|nr:alpha/beta hydrolase [Flammeovirga sp. SJP92]KXX70976.1 hypothetical protein AVL50_10240 [Flammeovirga sp. SJP92]
MNSKFYKEPEIKLQHRRVNGVPFYYRTAGNALNPTLLLLHGFPTNRNTFDELMPMLASHYHVIAPDNTDSDWTNSIDPRKTPFTFSLIADYMEAFLKEMEIDTYTLYIQNSAFNVGFQLIERSPAKIDALIVQNAELYIDALPEKRQALYKNADSDSSNAHLDYLWTISGENDEVHSNTIDTSNYTIGDWQDHLHFVQTEKQKLAMMQLLEDYKTIIQRFPEWQEMLNEKQPKTLVIWGEEDANTNFEGAKSYLKDLPEAELLLINSGKFSNKMFNVEVASKILNFLQRHSSHLHNKENMKPYLDAL